jgi:hypothetical protein
LHAGLTIFCVVAFAELVDGRADGANLPLRQGNIR